MKTGLHNRFANKALPLALCAICQIPAIQGSAAQSAQPRPSVQAVAAPTSPYSYADLADLASNAPVVARAKIRSVTQLKPERAPDVAAGHVRFFITARLESLIVGQPITGESIRYLVDLPLDARGRAPRVPKQSMLLFARPVAGRTSEIQLIAPDAQIPASPDTEMRVRSILREVYAADAPRRVTGLRELLHVPGNLAGEGETQIFLSTPDGSPASVTVVRRPGQLTSWGVSFSEIVDQAARPPARDTLGWYRLACFLPRAVPAGLQIAGSPRDQSLAREDYAMVTAQLGSCPRSRTPPR